MGRLCRGTRVGEGKSRQTRRAGAGSRQKNGGRKNGKEPERGKRCAAAGAFISFVWVVRIGPVKVLDEELLRTATQRLVAEFQPEQIWLFGSHAWGTPTEDSDVDLMVIVPASRERGIQRMQRAQHCLRGIGFSKDVLVPTRAEVDRYKHLQASLFHQVLAQGRKLYG